MKLFFCGIILTPKILNCWKDAMLQFEISPEPCVVIPTGTASPTVFIPLWKILSWPRAQTASFHNWTSPLKGFRIGGKMWHEERELLEKILHELHRSNELKLQIMTAIDTLTASVTAATSAVTSLTTAVDTAVTDLGTPAATDTQILTQATAVDALTAAITGLAARLNTATATPPPVVTPPPTP